MMRENISGRRLIIVQVSEHNSNGIVPVVPDVQLHVDLMMIFCNLENPCYGSFLSAPGKSEPSTACLYKSHEQCRWWYADGDVKRDGFWMFLYRWHNVNADVSVSLTYLIRKYLHGI